MRSFLVSGLTALLLVPLSATAGAADTPPNVLVIAGTDVHSLTAPAASTTADGGVTIGSVTITPPSGRSFADGGFDLGASRDATHGTMTGLECATTAGAVAVAESAASALALDVTSTRCSKPVAVSVRVASTTPYAVADLHLSVPRNVPYSGGTYQAQITNHGTTDLVPGALTVDNVANGTVNVSQDLCDGVTLSPGESCYVALAITPTSQTMSFDAAVDVPALPLQKLTRRQNLLGGTAPGQVTNVHVVGTALGRALVAWDAPSDTGGNPVNYDISYSGGGSTHAIMITPTSASVRVSTSAPLSLVVSAYNTVGYGPKSAAVAAGPSAQDGLVVLRPDGREWVSNIDTPDLAMPSELFPGGAPAAGMWLGNGVDGRVRTTGVTGAPYGGDAGPAGSDFAADQPFTGLYVRPDTSGNPAVVSNFTYYATQSPQVLLRGYAQPTANLTSIFAVPASKTGPTGGPLLQYLRDGRRVIVQGTEKALHPAASTDGRWLAYVQSNPAGGQALKLRTVGARSVKVLTSALPFTKVTAISWSPDASTIYVYDDSAKTTTRIAIDAATGFGAAAVIATGSNAGPARIATQGTPGVYAAWEGLQVSDTEPLAGFTCRLDGVATPCGGTREFTPHATPGQHVWTMTKQEPGGVPQTYGVTAVAHRVQRDFTGDGKADIAVFRPATGQWFVRGRAPVQWGQRGDTPLSADFNGDGKVDIAVYRPGTRTWFIRGSAPVQFGGAGDLPMPADYNGDGRDDIAVYRPATHQWFVRGQQTFQLGARDDVPLVGQWGNAPQDDRARPAVCRPGANALYVLGQHGISAACPTPDMGVSYAYDFLPGISDEGSFENGLFTDNTQGPVRFGARTDIPVVGDYFGDRARDLVVFRPSTGQWFTRGHTTVQFGGPGDVPL